MATKRPIGWNVAPRRGSSRSSGLTPSMPGQLRTEPSCLRGLPGLTVEASPPSTPEKHPPNRSTIAFQTFGPLLRTLSAPIIPSRSRRRNPRGAGARAHIEALHFGALGVGVGVGVGVDVGVGASASSVGEVQKVSRFLLKRQARERLARGRGRKCGVGGGWGEGAVERVEEGWRELLESGEEMKAGELVAEVTRLGARTAGSEESYVHQPRYPYSTIEGRKRGARWEVSEGFLESIGRVESDFARLSRPRSAEDPPKSSRGAYGRGDRWTDTSREVGWKKEKEAEGLRERVAFGTHEHRPMDVRSIVRLHGVSSYVAQHWPPSLEQAGWN
ncbi:hypothetical protein KM043_005170 [Ampulex compressa]|nr:hypothetical protein KM043_005170 [Ampulex compressa]